MSAIKQKTPHDCSICTIAMATGESYERVMEVALSDDSFHPTRGCRSEWSVIEKLGFEQMKDFRTLHRGPLSAEYFLHFSWGRRAILAVPSLNIEGGFHSVYFDGTALHDPCQLKTYTAWADLRPDEIILFGEADLVRPLRTAVSHIEHMAAWITKQNAGYSFESLCEDMPDIRRSASKTGETR